MKLAIVALVLAVCLVQSTEAWWGGLYGLGYGWGGLYGMYGMGMYGLWGKRQSTETMPREILKNKPEMERTECVYNRNTSMIMCIGLGEMVECKTELRWVKEDSKKEFLLYGIAKSETTPSSYRLLPRSIDNTAWLDNTYRGKQVSLFSSEKLDHFGLRVIDEVCFKRIDALFKVSRRNEKVYVKTNGLVEMPTTRIIGDLSVVNISEKMLEKSKRHWGYGGGYRYGGYRGGYGYGGGYRYGGGYGYGGYRGGWRG